MPFCQHCGGPVDSLPEAAVAAEAVHVDLEIARVNAERDVAIARLQARQDAAALEVAESIAETEAEAQVDTAVAVAEIIAAEDEPEAEPEPLGEPIVVEPAPKEKKSGGYWGNYR